VPIDSVQIVVTRGYPYENCFFARVDNGKETATAGDEWVGCKVVPVLIAVGFSFTGVVNDDEVAARHSRTKP